MAAVLRSLAVASGPRIELPASAIGTWAWGDKGGTWGGKGDASEEAEIKKALEKAFDLAGDSKILLDTAEVYSKGESEMIIGRLLKDLTAEKRARVVLATKFIPFPTPSRLWLPSGMVNALRASLDRLGLDKVDLYQIHGPIHLNSIKTMGAALAECVRLGLTRAVGVSNYSKKEMLEMHAVLKEHGIPLASNQVEFSLVRQIPFTSGLIEAAQSNDIVILAYSPLAMGRLSGKYSAANPPPSKRRFSDIPFAQLDPLLDEMRVIAKARGVSVPAVALNYTITKGTIPLGGVRNADQAEMNAQAVGWTLTDDERARLEAKGLQGKTDWMWQHG